MTKILKILTVFCLLGSASLLSSDVYAQIKGGIKGGLNVSNLYVDEVDDENARFGFNIGFYGQVLSSDAFAIQPELLFSTKGSKVEYGGNFFDQTIKYNLSYLDLPVLAVFKLGESAEIHIGPYASYLLGASISHEGNLGNDVDEIDKDHLKSFDYGLAGGFGLNFGNFQVGARYNYGLAKIADSDAAELLIGDSKNSVAQIYLALNLGNKNDD
ncbi:porin family protein [Chryseolinea sp. H1M3-3]|uniref:porin family protein n=1 Tax=Chryseolinea sp. H1M3-3 TaxID=3034144 RepID=UPI0023EBBE16|nr:porin family protein [Chryseolinea sp. H1M3-3]